MNPFMRFCAAGLLALGMVAGCSPSPRTEVDPGPPEGGNRPASTASAPALQGAPGVLASESFDYPTGSELGDWKGGSGFPEGWRAGGFNVVGAGYEIREGSLEGIGTGLATGHRIVSEARQGMVGMIRELPELPWEGGVFLSFRLRPEGVLHGGDQNGYFGVGLATEDHHRELFFGKPGAGFMDEYVMEERGGMNQISSGVKAELGAVAELVVEFQGLPDADRFTLRVNPQSRAEPGVVKVLPGKEPFTHLMVYSTGAFSLDEIRITRDWPMSRAQ